VERLAGRRLMTSHCHGMSRTNY